MRSPAGATGTKCFILPLYLGAEGRLRMCQVPASAEPCGAAAIHTLTCCRQHLLVPDPATFEPAQRPREASIVKRPVPSSRTGQATSSECTPRNEGGVVQSRCRYARSPLEHDRRSAGCVHSIRAMTSGTHAVVPCKRRNLPAGTA